MLSDLVNYETVLLEAGFKSLKIVCSVLRSLISTVSFGRNPACTRVLIASVSVVAIGAVFIFLFYKE